MYFCCLVKVPLVEVCQVCSLSETISRKVEKHTRRNYPGRSYPKTIRPLPSSICSPFSAWDLEKTLLLHLSVHVFSVWWRAQTNYELCFSCCFCVRALLKAFQCWGDGTHKGVRSSVDVPHIESTIVIFDSLEVASSFTFSPHLRRCYRSPPVELRPWVPLLPWQRSIMSQQLSSFAHCLYCLMRQKDVKHRTSPYTFHSWKSSACVATEFIDSAGQHKW